MKKLFPFLFLANCSFFIKAQNIILLKGEYMDTTFIKAKGCDDNVYHYYQVDGKYPMNSTSLVKKVDDFLKEKPVYKEVNGYITFRFAVNCEGKTSYYKIMQTDEKYQTTHFDKNLVNDLHAFVQTLDQWTIGKNRDNEAINYLAYISFKMKNGKIISIIP